MVDISMPEVIHEVVSGLDRAMDRFSPTIAVYEEGRVHSVHDGVARVSGLSSVGMDELVYLGDREPGMVLGLDRDFAYVALLGMAGRIGEGTRVRATGHGVSLPVGSALHGRVIDALGRPLDDEPLLALPSHVPHFRPAPQIYERAAIRRPLYTGILAIDAMFPIGRGQRELILGDDGTGKTSIALDVLIRQKNTGVVGVYVAIGRRRSEVSRVAEQLKTLGGDFVIVAAPEDTSVGLRYLAPYAGCAVAEYFMDRGRDALVVYDDLTAHAIAWRELSLLMRRPPGREAYPGDIFYQHSRLLERATQLSTERGGGSLTALPLARLESGRLSAYIPTNLISIADGQVVLSQPLFASGQKPAIDAGLSVSRVGGKAQPQAVAGFARRLRLDFAAFLEFESFARLGAQLDAGAERRMSWGRRVRTLLRAPRLRPYSLFDEVVRLALAADPDSLLTLPETGLGEHVEALCTRVSAELSQLRQRVEQHAILPDGDRRLLLTTIQRVIANASASVNTAADSLVGVEAQLPQAGV